VVRKLRPKDGPLYGVGVGLAGVIDRAGGVVRHATYADWRDVDLAGLLEKRLGLPVVVDNDVNTLVANEQWFGAGRGVADMAVVSIGRGIGLGMVLDGRLYRGAAGGAGEFGHLKVADGPECACGGRGCLEAVIGGPAILTRTGQATLEDAAALARDGDVTAREVFDEVRQSMSHAVMWTGTISNLPPNTTVEWKCIKRQEANYPATADQWGPDPNISFTTPATGSGGTTSGGF
jgi:predicted NBD/HSP70 family sugar kinase